MRKQEGFVLITVLIVVFVLATLGIMRLMVSSTRATNIDSYTKELQLLYLAETGISRAQSKAHDVGEFNTLLNNEYFLGNGSYEIYGDIVSLIKTVTVNSYIPNKADQKFQKTLVISGVSVTSDYTWREL